MLEYITAACSVCLLFWGQLQSTIQKSGLLMQVSAARPSHSFSCSLFPSLLPPLSRLSLSPSHTYISILFVSTKTLVPSRPPILLLCRFPFSPYLIMFNILYLPFSLFLFLFASCLSHFFALIPLSPSFPCLSLSSHTHFTSLLVFAPSLPGPTLILYSTAFCRFPLHTLLYLLHHTPPSLHPLCSLAPPLSSTLFACSFSSCLCLRTTTSHMAY